VAKFSMSAIKTRALKARVSSLNSSLKGSRCYFPQ